MNLVLFWILWHFDFWPAIQLDDPFVQELTLNHPNIVNAKKNMELVYGENTFLGAHLQ